MMNEDYESKPLNPDHLASYGGLMKTEIQTMSIVDVDQTESIVVKEELPAVCERLHDVIVPKMDIHDIKQENPDNGAIDREEDVLSLSNNIEEDSEDDVPLMEFKIEVNEEQIVSEQKQRAMEICYIKRDIGDSEREENVLSPSHNIGKEIEDVPLMEIGISPVLWPKPLNPDHLKSYGGLMKTEIQTMSIVDVDQTESIVVKEESPAVCERLDDIIVPKREYDSHDIKQENPDNRDLDSEEDLSLSHNIEEDSEDDVPSLVLKIEVEEEEKESEQNAVEICYIKEEKRDIGDSEREENVLSPSHNIGKEIEDVPLMKIKIEVKEEPEDDQKKQIAVERSWSTDEKKSKLHLRRSKVEDSIPTGQQKNQVSDSEINRNLLKERHICEICQRSFNKKMYLSHHIRTHSSEKPYKCNVCQRSFSKNVYLKKHMLIHTGKKSYKCNICQRSFTQSAHLTGHMVTHTGEKPYKCDVCQVCFARKSNLNQHSRVHTGKKNPYRKYGGKTYQCDICQMSFTDKSYLIRHIRMHTGDKPHKCDICQRGFIQKHHLTTHMRTHTGERPFKCEFCQRSFSDSGVLKKHIQIHTGEKPYKCDFCQHGFRRAHYLRNHIRRHTGEKPFHCNICQRSFHSNNTLKQHTRIKHSQDKPVQDDNVSEDLVKSIKDGAPVLA